MSNPRALPLVQMRIDNRDFPAVEQAVNDALRRLQLDLDRRLEPLARGESVSLDLDVFGRELTFDRGVLVEESNPLAQITYLGNDSVLRVGVPVLDLEFGVDNNGTTPLSLGVCLPGYRYTIQFTTGQIHRIFLGNDYYGPLDPFDAGVKIETLIGGVPTACFVNYKGVQMDVLSSGPGTVDLNLLYQNAPTTNATLMELIYRNFVVFEFALAEAATVTIERSSSAVPNTEVFDSTPKMRLKLWRFDLNT